jgi:hypothetical protein
LEVVSILVTLKGTYEVIITKIGIKPKPSDVLIGGLWFYTKIIFNLWVN